MFYTLLDAARMGATIAKAKELGKDHVSLYKGRSEEELVDYAPFLFPLQQAPALVMWLHEQGWGQSWGIFVQSIASPVEIYRHFRKFLLVQSEEGKELYFRFYDPRVLRVFLPTCDASQLHEFFGPIHYFLMEDEDSAFGLQFWLEGGKLNVKQILKADVKNLLINLPIHT